jgi:hypothetical protein
MKKYARTAGMHFNYKQLLKDAKSDKQRAQIIQNAIEAKGLTGKCQMVKVRISIIAQCLGYFNAIFSGIIVCFRNKILKRTILTKFNS